jgi:hypothetical protein
MPTNDDPDQLRARARSLRVLADQIEATPAMSLDRYTGEDTWVNPKADLCRTILRVNHAQVLHAVDELRWLAHRLDLHAVDGEIERARMWGVS